MHRLNMNTRSLMQGESTHPVLLSCLPRFLDHMVAYLLMGGDPERWEEKEEEKVNSDGIWAGYGWVRVGGGAGRVTADYQVFPLVACIPRSTVS